MFPGRASEILDRHRDLVPPEPPLTPPHKPVRVLGERRRRIVHDVVGGRQHMFQGELLSVRDIEGRPGDRHGQRTPNPDTTRAPNRSSQLRNSAHNKGSGASAAHPTIAGTSALRRAGTRANWQVRTKGSSPSRSATANPAASATLTPAPVPGPPAASPGQLSNGGPGSCGQGSMYSRTSSGTLSGNTSAAAGFDQYGSRRRRYSAKSAASTPSSRIASTSLKSAGW